MEDVYAEAMAAVAAIEGILEGHGATFTKLQTKELLHHLVKAAKTTQRHVQRFEEAERYAATAVTVMHTPKATLCRVLRVVSPKAAGRMPRISVLRRLFGAEQCMQVHVNSNDSLRVYKP